MPRKWETPLYYINLPKKKIVVNVTRSVPSFPGPTLGVADVAAELRKEGMKRVLDFGAGKLRNTLFLLRKNQGFKVWAVEYKDCFQTPSGQQAWNNANGYKDFFFLEYPDKFLDAQNLQVDAVFLINVANIVPDAADRRKIVNECTQRLRSGGWFLWMSQYGESYYKPGVAKRLQARDGGWFYNLDKIHQTYYRSFSIDEIKKFFSPSLYREPRKINAPHHRAYLFQKK